MKTLESRAFLTGFAAFVFFTGLAADAWRNSISWYGYGAIVALVLALSIVILVRQRRAIRWADVPTPLTVFLAFTTLSIIWSNYPGASAIGVVAQFVTTIAALAIALVLGVDELLRALGLAIRFILALSLAFELFVSVVVRHPVLPIWVTAEDSVDPPVILYWSRDLLLEGGKIQGINGSWSLIAMVALLGLIVFGVQLAAGSVRRASGIFWLVSAAVMVGLTRSGTIYVGIVAVAVVLAMILVMRRASSPRARRLTYGAIAVSLAAIVAAATVFRGPLLSAMGKSSDLTGRLDIWEAVIGLAQQRPVFGWGWISFWAPWVEPFRDLVIRNRVVQLHAHNAWLDVWLQVGIIGLVIFGALVAMTVVRSWLLATDRILPATGVVDRFSPLSLAAPLLITALLVQSLAESRLLVEGGWLLLVILAVSTKRGTSEQMHGASATTPAKVRSR